MKNEKDKKQSKIIVIGGGSFQGKSLIATHVAYKFRIPIVICTDTIRNVLHILNPEVPYFSTSTYLMTPENLETQMKEVSKILRELITIHHEKRGESIIIEGMHLSQELVSFLSIKPNVLAFCIDNRLSLKERLKYKSLTRCRVEYLDPETKEIKYGPLTENNIPFTPYIKHAHRIEEIHRQIVSWYKQNNLPVIEFEDINEGLQKIDKLVRESVEGKYKRNKR